MSVKKESYIIHSYRAPKSVNEFINNLLKSYPKELRHFFIHALLSTQSNLRDDEGWSPIPSKTIWKQWSKGLEISSLLEAGLIEIKILDNGNDYSKEFGLCREFRVSELVLENFLDSYPKATEEYVNTTYYNLVNGNKMSKLTRHKLTDDHKNSIPELAKKAMLSQERCVVSDTRLQEHLTNSEIEAILSDKAKKRLLIDKSAYNSFRSRCGLILLEDGLVEYYPSYTLQKYGRLTEEGSGMQSCTREMKEAGFSSVPNIRNYDILSSQPSILIQYFEEANIPTEWLTAYIKGGKEPYYTEVGITKDCWKQCFMALIMGGEIDAKANTEDEPINKVNQYIWAECEGQGEKKLFDPDMYVEKISKFDNLTKDLQQSLKLWHQWIIDVYIPRHSSYGKGLQYLTNKVGVKFCTSEFADLSGSYKKIKLLKRKLAAFLLQGAEATYVFHLTIVASKYSYEVISNQHDGIVTIGEIPQEAKDYAAKMSGLTYISLEEKPFV